jgi:hypothetical protein
VSVLFLAEYIPYVDVPHFLFWWVWGLNHLEYQDDLYLDITGKPLTHTLPGAPATTPFSYIQDPWSTLLPLLEFLAAFARELQLYLFSTFFFLMVGPRVNFLNCRHHKYSSALHILLTCACRLHSPLCVSEPTICSPSSSRIHSPGWRTCLTPKLPSLVVAKALLLQGNESCMSQARLGSGSHLGLFFFLPQHPYCAFWIIFGEIYALPTCPKKEGVPLMAFAPSACWMPRVVTFEKCQPASEPEQVEKQPKIVVWLVLVVQFLKTELIQLGSCWVCQDWCGCVNSVEWCMWNALSTCSYLLWIVWGF